MSQGLKIYLPVPSGGTKSVICFLLCEKSVQKTCNETWMQAGYTTHRVSAAYLYNDSLKKLISLSRPIRKALLFQRRAPVKPQWNINMQHNEHVYDTRSNSQWKKYKNGTMQIYPSRRAEMPCDTGSWITMNHVHTACIAHTVYIWPHGRSLRTYVYVPIIMYIAHAWGIPFQNFVSTMKLVYGIGSITLYLSISSC